VRFHGAVGAAAVYRKSTDSRTSRSTSGASGRATPAGGPRSPTRWPWS